MMEIMVSRTHGGPDHPSAVGGSCPLVVRLGARVVQHRVSLESKINWNTVFVHWSEHLPEKAMCSVYTYRKANAHKKESKSDSPKKTCGTMLGITMLHRIMRGV